MGYFFTPETEKLFSETFHGINCSCIEAAHLSMGETIIKQKEAYALSPDEVKKLYGEKFLKEIAKVMKDSFGAELEIPPDLDIPVKPNPF